MTDPGTTGQPPRVRVFWALELPAAVRSELARWRDRATSELSGLRRLADADLHVTLCFLGAHPAAEVPAILAAGQTVGRRGSVPLQVGAALWLPRRAPRVLAVTVEDPTGGLADIQQTLSAELASGGWYRPERRTFLAHATVARVRSGARVGRTNLETPPAAGFQGARVTLYRSQLRPDGARYEALGAVALE